MSDAKEAIADIHVDWSCKSKWEFRANINYRLFWGCWKIDALLNEKCSFAEQSCQFNVADNTGISNNINFGSFLNSSYIIPQKSLKVT